MNLKKRILGVKMTELCAGEWRPSVADYARVQESLR